MNADANAFPMVVSEETSECHCGLTKREYFALHLFTRLMSNSDDKTVIFAATQATRFADILLKVLEVAPHK